MQTRIRARRICYPRARGYFVPVAIFRSEGLREKREIDEIGDAPCIMSTLHACMNKYGPAANYLKKLWTQKYSFQVDGSK
jgi:hypothetical protein